MLDKGIMLEEPILLDEAIMLEEPIMLDEAIMLEEPIIQQNPMAITLSAASPNVEQLTPGAGALLLPSYTSPYPRPPLSPSLYDGQISPDSLKWTKLALYSPASPRPNTPGPAYTDRGSFYNCEQCENMYFTSLTEFMKHSKQHTIRRDGANPKRKYLLWKTCPVHQNDFVSKNMYFMKYNTKYDYFIYFKVASLHKIFSYTYILYLHYFISKKCL